MIELACSETFLWIRANEIKSVEDIEIKQKELEGKFNKLMDSYKEVAIGALGSSF